MKNSKATQYNKLSRKIEDLVGSMLANASDDQQVKSQKENARLLLQLASELCKVCD